MALQLSDLAPRTIQSEIRAMSVACDAIGGVNLAQGICDTEPPHVVLEAAQEAIRDGRNIYTRLDGIPRLRKSICAQLARTHGIMVDPDREILVTSGATGAFDAAICALLHPGDEFLLFEPFYGYHAGMLRGHRVVPQPVAMTAPADGESEWTLDPAAVRAAITPRTRAMMINTPSNPAGKVFTRAELELLASIAEEHNLFIFTDEIYEHFIYGDATHLSPASLPGMRERTILISGFSKTFSVTGWRIGYLVADPRWLPAIGYFHDLPTSAPPHPCSMASPLGSSSFHPPSTPPSPRTISSNASSSSAPSAALASSPAFQTARITSSPPPAHSRALLPPKRPVISWPAPASPPSPARPSSARAMLAKTSSASASPRRT